MAYDLKERFSNPPQYFRLLDPGAYQNTNRPKITSNKAPFLARSERVIKSGSQIWTHAIYFSDIKPTIPNCTAMMSKIPRFVHEKINIPIFQETICECKDPNICECEDEENVSEDILCQAKVHRTIYKGPPPRCNMGDGLSIPSKCDYGFKLLSDGSQKRISHKLGDDGPPFYNVEVNEATAFYRGCKWSRWTSKKKYNVNDNPGPAHYYIEHEPTFNEICNEKVRAQKRKTSKQYRFIEMVQRRNIIDGFPGPSSYSPELPKGTDLTFLGPKAPRFSTSQYNIIPGPTQHFIKRDFDPPEVSNKVCHARLPSSAPFGGKALRFKHRKEEGPSPASYNANYKPCQFIRCTKAPFLSSTNRFKEEIVAESDEEIVEQNEKENRNPKPVPTWQFKSTVPRMKPLLKVGPKPRIDTNELKPSKRYIKLQRIAPFFSSEARFRSWYNWIPVHAKEKTPGPAYYNLEPPKCNPAVHWGPLFKSPRFRVKNIQSPAPNKYKPIIALENILHTHNQRLKENLEKTHKFNWSPPQKPRKLSNEEKEKVLLRESIALLNTIDVTDNAVSNKVHPAHIGHDNKKMLRCFADD